LLVGAYQHGKIPLEHVLVSPTSIPGIEALHPSKS